jgi:hypothetical protein
MSSIQAIHKIIKPSSPLGVDDTFRLNEHLILFNREAIDVFFAGRVGRQKGLRPSAVNQKNHLSPWLIKNQSVANDKKGN